MRSPAGLAAALPLLLLALLLPAPAVAGRPLVAGNRKPAPSEAAATARWLAAQNTWGVLRFPPPTKYHPPSLSDPLYGNRVLWQHAVLIELALASSELQLGRVSTEPQLKYDTISSDLSGAPFGNVVSYSDGVPGESHGIPYFYLTTLDPTARDALEDERTSFTLSEFPLGTCGKVDPENPTCAKLTLTGKLKMVDHKSPEADLAKTALFSKHPEMEGWPKNHHFEIFKLEIENIFLIDWFGGPKPISPSQYLEYGRDQGSVMFL
ncbi:protein CREG1 [Hordeum vulgare]|nr:protein CREG1 [Hordeum vulgare]